MKHPHLDRYERELAEMQYNIHATNMKEDWLDFIFKFCFGAAMCAVMVGFLGLVAWSLKMLFA